MDDLFALTVLEIIRIGFVNTECGNPDMIGFANRKGNMVYVKKQEGSVVISVFKVSARCLYLEVEKESQIDAVVNNIKEKLKLR